MEVVPQINADPDLLRAINDVVVRRLRELGGFGQRELEYVGEDLGPMSPPPDVREDTLAQKIDRRASERGRREKKRGEWWKPQLLSKQGG